MVLHNVFFEDDVVLYIVDEYLVEGCSRIKRPIIIKVYLEKINVFITGFVLKIFNNVNINYIFTKYTRGNKISLDK